MISLEYFPNKTTQNDDIHMICKNVLSLQGEACFLIRHFYSIIVAIAQSENMLLPAGRSTFLTMRIQHELEIKCALLCGPKWAPLFCTMFFFGVQPTATNSNRRRIIHQLGKVSVAAAKSMFLETNKKNKNK